MARERVNRYELRSKRLALAGDDVSVKMEHTSHQKNKLKNTAEGMGRDVLIGVLGGGLASVLLGKYSFIVGLGVSGFGHFSENKALTALGFGMMASGTFMALTGKNPNEKKPLRDRIKERLEAFKEELKQKVFFDKIAIGNGSEIKKEVADAGKKETAASTSAKEEVNRIKKDASVNLQGIPAAEIERARKQATAEFEKEYAEYQKIIANEQTAKTAVNVSKTSEVKKADFMPGKKQTVATDSFVTQTMSDKDIKKELAQMEIENDPLY